MQATLTKTKNIISGIYKSIAIVAVVGIFVVMITQVFFRYVLNNSLSWSEELARFLFVWASMLGAAVVTGNHGHAAIKMLDSLFSSKANAIKEIIFDLVAAAIGLMLFYFGIKLVNGVWNQNSAALKLCYAYVYMAIPVGGIGIMIESILNALITTLSLVKPDKENDDLGGADT